MTDRISIVINGRSYIWVGGFGAILSSYEKGLKQGDCRVIDGEMYYVYMITNTGFFRKQEISWSIPKVTIEHIREIKQKLLGG